MDDLARDGGGWGRLEQATPIQLDPGLQGRPIAGEEGGAILIPGAPQVLHLGRGEEAAGDGQVIAVGQRPFAVDTEGPSPAQGHQGQIATGGEVEL